MHAFMHFMIIKSYRLTLTFHVRTVRVRHFLHSALPLLDWTKEEKGEECRCNYEWYRVLVQNGFHGVSEADVLAKINVEEMYPEPSYKFSYESK